MITYSRWNPAGGYDYFVADEFAALGDDLEDPPLPAATPLGVPSVEVGHRLPVLSRFAGTGAEPVGILAPMDTSRLPSTWRGPAIYFGLGAVVTTVLWAASELYRRYA